MASVYKATLWRMESLSGGGPLEIEVCPKKRQYLILRRDGGEIWLRCEDVDAVCAALRGAVAEVRMNQVVGDE